MLRADPARIQRWARRRLAPLVRRPEGPALPRVWVDAACGRSPSDPASLLGYWLERLAPPPPEARRAARDAGRLPTDEDVLLTPEVAARRLYADVARVSRYEAEGTLPALRLDGATRYDAALVGMVADGEAAAAAARREEVEAWSRFEYVTGLAEGVTPPPTDAPPAPAKAVSAAPRAWHLPDDIADMGVPPEVEALPEGEAETEGPPPDGSRLIRTEGFETEDED